MKEEDLELWVKYRSGIDERNAKGWEECSKTNERLREEHRESEKRSHERMIEHAKESAKLFDVPYFEPFRRFSMAPYQIFIGEKATYEGFLDYLVELKK